MMFCIAWENFMKLFVLGSTFVGALSKKTLEDFNKLWSEIPEGALVNVPLKYLNKNGYLQALTDEQRRQTNFPVPKAHWAKLIKEFGALKY